MEWSVQKKLDKKLAKQKARQTWHKWFAWFPVPLNGHKKIWLETVYRKEDNYEGNWKYQTLMDFLTMEETKDDLKGIGATTAQGFNYPKGGSYIKPSRLKSPGVTVKETDV